jgi:hypothetical protein
VIGTPVQDLRGGETEAIDLPLEVTRDHANPQVRYGSSLLRRPDYLKPKK